MQLRLHDNSYPQFNLIGYSYGSVIALQLAMKYALKGSKVDYLVLIGSPITKAFLTILQTNSSIGKVIVVDLTAQGDPIHVGVNMTKLLLNANKH